jgi:Ca2+-transporting ATPase
MTLSVIQLYDGATPIPETSFAPSPDVALALRIAVLANRAELVESQGEWKPQGDPTEAAVLVAARKAGLDYRALRQDWLEIGELPFSSERMYMATFHRTPQGPVACVKGAPGRLVPWSTRALTREGPRVLDDAGRNRLLELNRELAGRGHRVLAVAMKQTDGITEEDLRGLTWVGYLGLSDPPAPGVQATIRSFQEAGIRTVMLTGDQQLTAESVARDLGLLASGAAGLDGRELDRLSDDDLSQAVGQTVVYSRVSPEAKLRIVSAYQAREDIVAMLGDGVNDAAALRKADIGVAMGLRGTDLAKEAADVILADDRFATIAVAVEQGRIIFDNIRKFVFYLFSCNLAELIVMLGAGLVGFPVPLLPLQILWLNLVTDTFPALVLAVEPGEPGVMQQPPRDPRAAILDAELMRATVLYGVLIAACALGAFAWGLSGPGGGTPRASTLAFLTLAFAQIFHLGNARSAGPVLSVRRALSNPLALAAVALALALQLLAVEYPPIAEVLRVRPPDPWDWIVAIALGLVPAVAGQTVKAARAMHREPSRRAAGSSGR